MKISYLGPKGTYTGRAAEMLAEKLKEKPELIDVNSAEAAAKAVASGESDLGVIAYYNYLEGLVQECLDLIYENRLNIIGAHRLPIELSIAGYPGSTDYSKIYSHPKALAQCSERLWEYYPESRQVPAGSTAAGAKIVRDTKSGLAIASADTLEEEYGLEIIARDIGNRKHGKQNYTDFYLLSRENGKDLVESKEYLTMIAITPHFDRRGLLAGILNQIAWFGLNNAKIHSRPAIDEVKIDNNGEPQMFYLEVMCHKDNPDFKKCIESLEQGLNPEAGDIEAVRVLGSYEKPCL